MMSNNRRKPKNISSEKEVHNTMEVNDLRSALELLKTMPGQLWETKEEIDPEAELSMWELVELSCVPPKKDRL